MHRIWRFALAGLWVLAIWATVFLSSACDGVRAESVSVSQEPGVAQQDALSVSATVTPPGMAVPQQAQVYLTIANAASDPITDIRVFNAAEELLEEVGTLSGADKSSYVFSESITPTAKQLKDGGIEYVLKYAFVDTRNETQERELKVTAPLIRLKAEPSLDFTRSLSSAYAQPGEEISITYRIRNTGNVLLTNLALRDPIFGEITQLEELEPGKKFSFTQKVKIEKTSESRPQVTYRAAGSNERLSARLDALQVFLADELLDLTLSADKSAVSPGQLVTLQLKLTNRGNVSYEKLEISDQTLGPLGSLPVDLNPGEEYVFVKFVRLNTTTTFLFSLSGNSVGGSLVSSASNMLTIAVTPVVDAIKLTLDAVPSATALSEPGPVTFQINLYNAGELDIRNVLLSERVRGEIKNLAVAAPGDTMVEQIYDIKEPSSFVFMAELSDSHGEHLTVLSPEIKIDIQPDGAKAFPSLEPNETSILDITNGGYRMEESQATFDRMVFIMLCILAALVLLFVVGALTRLNRRRQKKQKQIRKLRRSNRNARLEAADMYSDDNDTGVYKKLDVPSQKD